MANEITLFGQLQVVNGNSSFVESTPQLSFDQAALGGPTPGMVTIGTSEETITFSELSTPGWCMMRNLDDVNYVQWGFSTGVYGGRMGPGEPAGPFKLDPGATLYMLANTAACKVTVYALEN